MGVVTTVPRRAPSALCPVWDAGHGRIEPRAARPIGPGLPPPHPLLRACVIVPARNEEVSLPVVIEALARQRDVLGRPYDSRRYEVLLLLNNCTDRTAKVARALRQRFPRLVLHVAEVDFPPEEAHVGRARQALFDTAQRRFQMLERPEGLILTTDADSRPEIDWLAQNEAEIATGVEGVGGRITLLRDEEAAFPEGVRRLFLLDIGYRRALEELRSLYAPEPHDPFPRHHQHFGGSLAVTAAGYLRAGGMPLRRANEDVALHRAIIESGGRFRHSYRVRVHTSARMCGRASGGLADAILWWNDQAHDAAPVLVESASAAKARLAQLGIWSAENPGRCPPSQLLNTPEPPPPEKRAEIHHTLRELRAMISDLRLLPLAARLDAARRNLGLFP